MLKNIFEKKCLVYLFYIVIFSLILLPGIMGMGQYWDWNFPLYSSNLKNIYFNQSSSWNDHFLGNPMIYSSSFYFRSIYVLISNIQIAPEIVLYLLYVLVLSSASYGAYLILRRINYYQIGFIVGLVAILNPAILYKLIAGHTYYLVSYLIFIYLIYFLLNYFKPNFKSYLLLGLFLAFSGIQIQFFIFSLILVIVYFIFNIKHFYWKYASVSLLIAFLVNLPWLSNYLIGANSVKNFAQTASAIKFSGASYANPFWIITFLFSKSTLIKYLYPNFLYVYFGLSYLFLLYFLIRFYNSKKKVRKKITLSLLLIFLVLSTGFFHYFKICYLESYFSIFREVGHFAPIVVLFLILSISFLIKEVGRSRSKIFKILFFLYLIIFALVNAWGFARYLPTFNYSMARNSFDSFDQFAKKDISSYRILTYPFFNQYGFLNNKEKYSKGYLLNNSGYDSYTLYSDKSYIDNYADKENFSLLAQRALLTNYNLEPFAKMNVKYLFDFSDIYESNFELYVEPEVYDNDLSLIKNDHDFFEKIIKNNPGEVEQVSDKIMKIKNYKPRIYGSGVTFQKINSTKYKIYIENLKDIQDLEFVSSYHPDWKLYLQKNPGDDWCNKVVDEQLRVIECKSEERNIVLGDIGKLNDKIIFDDSHREGGEFGHLWEIDPEYVRNNFDQSYYKIKDDGSIDIELELYFRPQSYYLIGLLISLATILATVGYLIVARVKGSHK